MGGSRVSRSTRRDIGPTGSGTYPVDLAEVVTEEHDSGADTRAGGRLERDLELAVEDVAGHDERRRLLLLLDAEDGAIGAVGDEVAELLGEEVRLALGEVDGDRLAEGRERRAGCCFRNCGGQLSEIPAGALHAASFSSQKRQSVHAYSCRAGCMPTTSAPTPAGPSVAPSWRQGGFGRSSCRTSVVQGVQLGYA